MALNEPLSWRPLWMLIENRTYHTAAFVLPHSCCFNEERKLSDSRGHSCYLPARRVPSAPRELTWREKHFAKLPAQEAPGAKASAQTCFSPLLRVLAWAHSPLPSWHLFFQNVSWHFQNWDPKAGESPEWALLPRCTLCAWELTESPAGRREEVRNPRRCQSVPQNANYLQTTFQLLVNESLSTYTLDGGAINPI